MTNPKRYLAVGLSSGNVEDLPDGGMILHDVPMLRAGTWTDSVVGTPLNYPEKTLMEYASNWADNPYWSRHSGGSPHDITDKIGDITNPRYQDNGVYADIHFHGATSQSKDAISYLKWATANGKEVFSSVEHGGVEVFNPETKQMEAKSITFFGAAMVNRGACKTCQLPRANERTLADGAGFVPQNPPDYGKAPEDQEWSALKLSDFTSERWNDLSEDDRRGIASHFAYAGSLDSFGDLKLPHHDKNGNVVWRGVTAAYAALQGARGGVKIPAEMRDKVEAHIKSHYKDFEKDVPERAQEDNMTEDMVTKAEFDELAGSVKKLASAIEIMVNERNQKELEEAEEAKKKALSDSIAEQTKALDERIKALEESGTPKTGTKTETKDEGEPINRGLEYGKKGTIRVM